MAVYRACYATRQDVLSATDIAQTQDFIRHVDSALEAASDDVDRLTKRRFWNAVETNYFNWPNFQRAYPWRLWLDEKELAQTSDAVLAVGGDTGQSVAYTTIPSSQVMYEPNRYGPPFTWLELDRSTSAAFGAGATPQRSIQLAGTYGYWAKTRPGGTLTASVSSVTATTAAVSDSHLVGVGDVITVDTEAMLVQDAAFADTGVAGSGCSTADTSDNVLTVPDGTKFAAGEVLQLDAEQLLALTITGNQIAVERGYNGTVLAAHTAIEVYAARSLTVERGFGGTTAATHTSSAAVSVALVPGQVRELTIAEALNYVFQKTSGYARTIGENGARMVPGGSLPDLRQRVAEQFGRKARQRVV